MLGHVFDHKGMPMATQYLRFSDLRERKIVSNRTTLSRWQKQLGFPEGVLLGPRTRAWPEDEVRAWEDGRRSIKPAEAAA